MVLLQTPPLRLRRRPQARPRSCGASSSATSSRGWTCSVQSSGACPGCSATPRRRTTRGAQDRTSTNFMGLASLGLDIDIFCDFLYIFLRLSVILGLGCLGLVLSRPQVQLHRRPARQEHAMWRPGALLEEGHSTVDHLHRQPRVPQRSHVRSTIPPKDHTEVWRRPSRCYGRSDVQAPRGTGSE